MRAERLALGLCIALVAGGCATRTAAPVAGPPAFPDFMYPAPQGVGSADDSARMDRAWRFLQSRDLATADREFSAVLKRTPGMYPALAGGAYVALARGNHSEALTEFDAALRSAPRYVPALVGRGQTLLALNRNAAALEAFEAALAVDPSLTDLRGRVDVLRFRALQELIETGRRAAAANRLDEAASAYERAVAASPETAFLHRDLGLVLVKQGHTDAALSRFQRAVQLDPADAASLVQIGEILERRQDFMGAEAAYRQAALIAPSADLDRRLTALAERSRDAALPGEFRAIPAAAQIRRGDLAALIGVRLNGLLGLAAPREVVVTDIAGHWAAQWITAVVRAGVIEPFANHTFQPGSLVTRADLASAVSRIVALAASRRPELRPYVTARPAIADMPTGHLSYPAASVAVASGVMPLSPDGRFQVAQPVSGAEAEAAVLRLRDLAGER